MSEISNAICLTHNFLIAMPAMEDPNFVRSLTYICEHNKQGALGIIVNRPTDMDLETLFERVNIPFDVTHQHPDLGLTPSAAARCSRWRLGARPSGQWQSTLAVRDDIGLTSTRDILVGIGANGEPADILVTLGYADGRRVSLSGRFRRMPGSQWQPILGPVIFELPPEERLVAAMQLLGVDFANLSDVAGHA